MEPARWELLPEIVVGVGLSLFLVRETSAATSAFKSNTANLLITLVAAAWMTGRILLIRHTPWPVLRLAVFAVAAGGVLTSSCFPPTTTPRSWKLSRSRSPSRPRPPDRPRRPHHRPLPRRRRRRPRPPRRLRRSRPNLRRPRRRRSRCSTIHGIDHRASGTAVIYRQPDGSLVVGLEDIDIQPGPD